MYKHIQNMTQPCSRYYFNNKSSTTFMSIYTVDKEERETICIKST